MSRRVARAVALQQSLLKWTSGGISEGIRGADTLSSMYSSSSALISLERVGDVGVSSVSCHITGERAPPPPPAGFAAIVPPVSMHSPPIYSTTRRIYSPSSSFDFLRHMTTKAATTDVRENIREEILEKALTCVEKFGWTNDSLQQACVDLGISPAAAGALRPGDLVHYFNKKANQELAHELMDMHSSKDSSGSRELLMTGIRARLTLLLPYRHSWAQALAVLVDPKDVEYALQNARDTSDIIWRFAGDSSLDMTWYTKRILLGAILQSAEVYLLTDASLEDTMAYVDRCLGLVMK